MKNRPGRVLESYNFDGALRCVDVFEREDGTFGFEAYRRDPEDNRGWYPVGHFSGVAFPSRVAALQDAMNRVEGLREVIERSELC